MLSEKSFLLSDIKIFILDSLLLDSSTGPENYSREIIVFDITHP